MNTAPVVAMVWEGLGAVKTGRVMLGETNPKDSKPGTIRGDFCVEVNSHECIIIIDLKTGVYLQQNAKLVWEGDEEAIGEKGKIKVQGKN